MKSFGCPIRICSREQTVGDVICNAPIAPASRYEAACAGDLDAILKKALRKEAHERYATVEQLADDLRSYLAQRPIRLRQDDILYRVRKFLRRRWLPVAAVSLAVLGLAGGFVMAQRERALAERRFALTRRLANVLLTDIHDKVMMMPGEGQCHKRVG